MQGEARLGCAGVALTRCLQDSRVHIHVAGNDIHSTTVCWFAMQSLAHCMVHQHAQECIRHIMDCACCFPACSMSVVSADQTTFLVMGAVGSSHEATTIPNTVRTVQGSGSSVEMIMNGALHTLPQHKQATGRSDDSISCDNSNQPLQWAQEDGVAPPSDWVTLQCAGGLAG